MPKDKKLSISIVNFQSEDFIEDCLASVFDKAANLDCEVIIVNNDEKEDLMEIKKRFSEIKIVDHKKNVGFGAGHNLGAKETRGEFILFLNPDVELTDNISPIIKLLENNENIGIVGPQLLTDSGEIQAWSVGRETNIWELIKNNLGFSPSKKLWKSTQQKEVHWVSGAALFIRKSLWEKLGGFDEKFFMFFEDEDLCKRARKNGSQVIYFPEVRARHACGKSTKDKKLQKEWFYKSQDYYFRKHFSKKTVNIIKLARKLFSKNRKHV